MQNLKYHCGDLGTPEWNTVWHSHVIVFQIYETISLKWVKIKLRVSKHVWKCVKSIRLKAKGTEPKNYSLDDNYFPNEVD